MRLIALIFFLVLHSTFFAQSKNKKILILVNRLDSLSEVVDSERELYSNEKFRLNVKLDSLNASNALLKSQILKLENNYNYTIEGNLNLRKENNNQRERINALNVENIRLKDQNDSLLVLMNKKDDFQINIEPEMIFVEGGDFLMGNNKGNRAEKPVHSVELSPFYIGKYEVTRELWIEVMGSDLGEFRDCAQCPIDCVNWINAQDFIKKLNARTGKNFRLPTEAEWEYAARGGKMNCKFKYSGSDNLDEVGWYIENSFGQTHPVGSKKANALGVYDMSGNVLEWCSDWYEEYKQVSILNPVGPNKGFDRVIRGGRWESDDESCSVSYRYGYVADESNSFFGFRLALSVD